MYNKIVVRPQTGVQQVKLLTDCVEQLQKEAVLTTREGTARGGQGHVHYPHLCWREHGQLSSTAVGVVSPPGPQSHARCVGV